MAFDGADDTPYKEQILLEGIANEFSMFVRSIEKSEDGRSIFAVADRDDSRTLLRIDFNPDGTTNVTNLISPSTLHYSGLLWFNGKLYLTRGSTSSSSLYTFDPDSGELERVAGVRSDGVLARPGAICNGTLYYMVRFGSGFHTGITIGMISSSHEHLGEI